ncbi:hypothetical protein LTR56_018870 [Elasticomyces elasticus]|nr:hypothetical protein LTR56_018870 [Elasticomyces elasticus]
MCQHRRRVVYTRLNYNVAWVGDITTADICEALGIDEAEFTQAKAAILPTVNGNATRSHEHKVAHKLADAILHFKDVPPNRDNSGTGHRPAAGRRDDCYEKHDQELLQLQKEATLSDSNNTISFVLRSKDYVTAGSRNDLAQAHETKVEAKVREAEQVKRKARDEEAKKKRREVERREREKRKEIEADKIARRKLEEEKKNKKKKRGASEAKVSRYTEGGFVTTDFRVDEHLNEVQPQNARRRMPILTIFNPNRAMSKLKRIFKTPVGCRCRGDSTGIPGACSVDEGEEVYVEG